MRIIDVPQMITFSVSIREAAMMRNALVLAGRSAFFQPEDEQRAMLVVMSTDETLAELETELSEENIVPYFTEQDYLAYRLNKVEWDEVPFEFVVADPNHYD